MPLESSAESPLPVRTVALAIGGWIARLGRVWVEGQVTQLTRRPGQGTVFLTLRDPVAEVSLQVTCSRAVCDAAGPALDHGSRVVVAAKPDFYLGRGTLSLLASEIRAVGLGALLARVEATRKLLAAEGLFAAERKRPLPFLPSRVGVITGRASAAERDLLENGRRRWPGVRFRVEPVSVQGPYAVTEVCAALRALDADTEVDVIVLARGGGSVEDLLPFSDETLCRAVAGCRTPVVSAIGHEGDAPLVDLVADRRASTPTDAAKLVVPDFAEQAARVRELRDRARAAIRARVLRDGELVATGRARARRCLVGRLEAAEGELLHTRARVRALSPAATLARGYAVLQRHDGAVVRAASEVVHDERLDARLAGGRLTVRVEAVAGPS